MACKESSSKASLALLLLDVDLDLGPEALAPCSVLGTTVDLSAESSDMEGAGDSPGAFDEEDETAMALSCCRGAAGEGCCRTAGVEGFVAETFLADELLLELRCSAAPSNACARSSSVKEESEGEGFLATATFADDDDCCCASSSSTGCELAAKDGSRTSGGSGLEALEPESLLSGGFAFLPLPFLLRLGAGEDISLALR